MTLQDQLAQCTPWEVKKLNEIMTNVCLAVELGGTWRATLAAEQKKISSKRLRSMLEEIKVVGKDVWMEVADVLTEKSTTFDIDRAKLGEPVEYFYTDKEFTK